VYECSRLWTLDAVTVDRSFSNWSIGPICALRHADNYADEISA
jgi:hypothetical protein